MEARFKRLMLACAALAFISLAAAPFPRSSPAVILAMEYNQEAFTSSIAVFGSLRIIDSALSTAQETQVSVPLVGGVTASPLRTLEPVDDAVERMSSIVFTISVISGSLAILIPYLSSVGATLCGVGFAGLSARYWLLMRAKDMPPLMARSVRTTAVVGVFLFVVMPVAYALAFLIGNQATNSAWEQADGVLGSITGAATEQSKAAEAFDAQIRAEIEAHEAVTKNAQEPDKRNLIVQASVTSVPEHEEPQEESLVGKALSWVGSATTKASEKVGNVVESTKEAASELASSMSAWAAQAGSSISETTSTGVKFIEAADDLFLAFVNIAVAYVVKLILLPLVLALVGYLILTRSLRSESSEVLRALLLQATPILPRIQPAKSDSP